MSELSVRRTIELSGTIQAEGASMAVLNATVSSDPEVATQYRETITNSGLYYTHVASARKQIAEFREKIYEAEDSLISQEDISETPTEPAPDGGSEEGEGANTDS